MSRYINFLDLGAQPLANNYLKKRELYKKEIKYFEDKFEIKIAFFADPQLIIPEYSIDLLDKNKVTINKIKNVNIIEGLKNVSQEEIKKTKVSKKDKKSKKSSPEKIKKIITKKVKKKSPRTLWIRKKKAS